MITARKCLPGGLVFVLIAGLAQADELPTFHLELGAYKSDFDTTLRIDGEGVGSEIDLEKDLNFDTDDTAFRLDGYWRFADRHRVMFAYYDLTREARALLTEDIIIEDVLYPAGSGVEGGFDIWVLQLAYSYSVVQTQRGELGLSIGVHWPGIDFSLRGVGIEGAESSEADLNAPLPVIGADGRYQLLDWLYVSGRVQYFSLNYRQYDGTIIDSRVALEAWPFDWLGVGLGYAGFDLDFSVDDKNWFGKLDYTYEGPQLFLIAEF